MGRRGRWVVGLWCLLGSAVVGSAVVGSAVVGSAVAAERGLAGVTPEPAEVATLLRALEAGLESLDGGFAHGTPWTQVGNFYQRRWCRGAGARDDCQIASGTADLRDQHAVELYTLFYDQDWPRTFGIGLNALRVPAGPGLGVSVWLSEGGQRIVGTGSGVTLRWYPAPTGAADVEVSVGSEASYRIGETTLRVAAAGTPLAVLRRLMVSPAALRDEGRTQLAALAAEVDRALKAGEVQRCEYGPYHGDGIPPVCTPRPLTAAEQEAERATFKAWLAARLALLEARAEDAWKLAMMTVPVGALQDGAPRKGQ
ncbi:MAG: hypothetical protein R3F60_30430 [bacterium]